MMRLYVGHCFLYTFSLINNNNHIHKDLFIKSKHLKFKKNKAFARIVGLHIHARAKKNMAKQIRNSLFQIETMIK